MKIITQIKWLHAQQVKEYPLLHGNQPVAAAHRLTHSGIRLPVLLVPCKNVPIPNSTTPQKQSQGQQLQRRKPDWSRGMRAAAHASATAINHSMAFKLNTKAATKEKPN